MSLNENKKGFSLVEVLIATFIFSAGIIVVAQMMLVSIRESVKARDEIVAANLAQEGLELMKNFRDANVAAKLNDATFAGGAFSQIISGSSNYYCPREESIANAVSGVVAANLNCNGGNGELFLDNVRLSYTYDSDGGANQITKYKRWIEIFDINGGLDRKVVATVVWGDLTPSTMVGACNSENKCYQAEELLTGGWQW